MSLNKAIKYGKEHRKEYDGAKSIDAMCRNHKGCKWCEDNRTYQSQKQIQKTNEMLKEVKNYSDLPKEIKLQDDIDSLLYTNMELEDRIDKAIEKLRLCNSECAKETIDILRGNDEKSNK